MTRKRYATEFKAQAVELVGLGKPVPEVAEDLGIGSSILYGWVRRNCGRYLPFQKPIAIAAHTAGRNDIENRKAPVFQIEEDGR